MDGINKKREQLKKAYPNKEWAKRVDRFPPSQVVAVYTRLRQQKKI